MKIAKSILSHIIILSLAVSMAACSSSESKENRETAAPAGSESSNPASGQESQTPPEDGQEPEDGTTPPEESAETPAPAPKLSIDPTQEHSDDFRGVSMNMCGATMMVSDGEWMYCVTNKSGINGDLYKASVSGGMPTRIAQGVIDSEIVLHNGWIYGFARVDKEGSNAMVRVSVDGSQVETIGYSRELSSEQQYTYETIMDVTDTSIYFRAYYFENYEKYSFFFRADLDGSNVELLPLDYEALAEPLERGMFQFIDGWIYYCGRPLEDQSKGCIFRVRVDGSDFETLFELTNTFFVNFAFDGENTIYVLYKPMLVGMTLDGQEVSRIDVGTVTYKLTYMNGLVCGHDPETGEWLPQFDSRTFDYEVLGWGYDTDCLKYWTLTDITGARYKLDFTEGAIVDED